MKNASPWVSTSPAAVGRDRIADQLRVGGQDVAVGTLETLEELGGTLDIGEHERERLVNQALPWAHRDRNLTHHQQLFRSAAPKG